MNLKDAQTAEPQTKIGHRAAIGLEGAGQNAKCLPPSAPNAVQTQMYRLNQAKTDLYIARIVIKGKADKQKAFCF